MDAKTILTLPMSWGTVTGAELRAARKAAGLTQAALAKKAYLGRHAVIYWEKRGTIRLREIAPRRIAYILGVSDNLTTNARAGGWGVSPLPQSLSASDECPPLVEKPERELCGAKTRKGCPCRLKSEPGKRRCKFHGGKSTGPKTVEGRARIAEAQRRRWRARILQMECSGC